ncbi:MAG: metallophosphoesterase [Bacteroidota bacterium]
MKKSALQILISICILLFSLESCKKAEQKSDGEDWSFVVCSDPQQGLGIYSVLAKEMAEINPAPKASFCCGDIMLRAGNEGEWINFWKYSEPITELMPLHIARGNHDGFGPAAEEMMHTWGRIPGDHLYYSTRVSNASCIVLDCDVTGEENSITGEQLIWLHQQLDAATNDVETPYIFIFLHKALFSQGLHAGNTIQNNESLHQLFISHPKVKAVFAGHDHLFNKFYKDGLCYITTGGAGAAIDKGFGGEYNHFVKVSFFSNPSRINIKTIGLFNEEIEDFDL